jgi:outer membrane lipoprotein-sorting protein
MTHPSDERLFDVVLNERREPSRDDAVVREHLSKCPKCAARAEAFSSLSHGLAKAHAGLDRGHEAGRRRLMAALAADADRAVSVVQRSSWKGFLVNRRTWFAGAAAAGLALLFGILVPIADSPSAFAQMTEKLRTITSYRCTITSNDPTDAGLAKLFWAAPGSFRSESYKDGKLTELQISPAGKPGIELDYENKTFRRLDAAMGVTARIMMLGELAKYSGQADRKLEPKQIGGKQAPGFEVAVDKVDPDFSEGKVRVWIDPATQLPAEVELVLNQGQKELIERMHEFHWDEPSGAWFDAAPPKGFVEFQPVVPRPSVEAITKAIVLSLKTYAKYSGGKYPAAKFIYGDATSDELFKLAKLKSRLAHGIKEEADSKAYVDCSNAANGFGWINTLQRHNPDWEYNGKTVLPTDKDKVLFRWKLPGGEHRVIYGDLRAESAPADRFDRAGKK